MIYTSYDVLLHNEVPFEGHNVTALLLGPFMGKIPLKNLHWGRE